MENVKTWMLLRVLNNAVDHANLQHSLTMVIMQNQIKFSLLYFITIVSLIFILFVFSYVENWNQVNDCQCCQMKEYMGIIANLKCEDGKRLKKQMIIPRSCSCQNCGSSNVKNENKTKTKG